MDRRVWRTPTLIRVGAEGNESGAEDFLLLLVLVLVFLLLLLHRGAGWAVATSRDQPQKKRRANWRCLQG